MHVPCDCSILWMWETINECPGVVTFELDEMPCGVTDWADVPDQVGAKYNCAGDVSTMYILKNKCKAIHV